MLSNIAPPHFFHVISVERIYNLIKNEPTNLTGPFQASCDFRAAFFLLAMTKPRCGIIAVCMLQKERWKAIKKTQDPIAQAVKMLLDDAIHGISITI